MEENENCNDLSISNHFIGQLKKDDLFKISLNLGKFRFDIPLELIILNNLIERNRNPIIAIIPYQKDFASIYLALIRYYNIARKFHLHMENKEVDSILSIFKENYIVSFADKKFIYKGTLEENGKFFFVLVDNNGMKSKIPIENILLLNLANDIKSQKKLCKMTKKDQNYIDNKKKSLKNKDNKDFFDSLILAKGKFAKSIIIVTRNKTLNNTVLNEIFFNGKSLSEIIMVAEYLPNKRQLKYNNKYQYGGNAIILVREFQYCEEIVNIETIDVDTIYYEDYNGDYVTYDEKYIKDFLENHSNIKVLSLVLKKNYYTIDSAKYEDLGFEFYVQPQINFKRFDKRTKNKRLVLNNSQPESYTFKALTNNYWESELKDISLIFVDKCEYYDLNQEFYQLTKDSPDDMGNEYKHLYYTIKNFLYKIRVSTFVCGEETLKCFTELEEYTDALSNLLTNQIGKETLLSLSHKLKKFILESSDESKNIIDSKFYEIKEWGMKLGFSRVIIVPNEIRDYEIDIMSNNMNLENFSTQIITEREFLQNNKCYEEVLLTATFYKKNLEAILYSGKVGKVYIAINMVDALLINSYMTYNKTNSTPMTSDISFLGKEYDTSVNINKQDFEILKSFVKNKNPMEIQHNLNNDYKSKISRYKTDGENTIHNVIMVTFVDGSICFYPEKHKVSSVDFYDNNKKIAVDVSTLKNGEYLVLRDSGVDLISSVAETILEEKGQKQEIANSTKWRSCFLKSIEGYSNDYVIQKLKNKGMNKIPETINSWITNDDIICPNDFNDLKILELFCNKNKFDSVKVFASSKIVKSAHIQAGKKISKSLMKFLSNVELKRNQLDEYMIKYQIDGIGTVSLYKVDGVSKVKDIPCSLMNKILR